MITTFGVTPNEYYQELVKNEVLLEDLLWPLETDNWLNLLFFTHFKPNI
jgi:hypothetical protein